MIEESRKEYWDTYSILTTAENKGRVYERLSIARNLKSMNLPIADIAKATGLTADEIEKL